MLYFFAYYGVWLAIAFLVGALAGAFSLRREGDDPSLLREGDFLLALALCLTAVLTKATLGRVALYLEGASALYVAFLGGVITVVVSTGPVARDRIGWRIGAGAVALIAVIANSEAAANLESDLAHGLGSLVQREGGDPLDFEVSGRDVFLPADAPGHRALAERLAAAAGVRTVWRVDALSPPAAAQRAEALASASAEQTAHRAAEAAWMQSERERVAAALAARSPAETSPPFAKKNRKAGRLPEGRSARPAPLAEAPAPGPLVWNAPADPTLPAPEEASASPTSTAAPSPCRAALSALAASRTIRFSAKSVVLGSGTQKFLVRLAGSLKACPEATLDIRGHADSPGSPETERELSERRAVAVANYLRRLGVASDRVTSGASNEQADAVASRAELPRVEISVR